MRFNSKASPFGADLSAIACNTPGSYVCEARVQTVTYYTWFVANWVDLLLGFLLVILFVALCVSVCSFGSGPKRTNPHPANRRPMGTRRPRTTDPNQMNGVAMGRDLPPSYDSSVRIHKPALEPQTAVRTISGGASAAGASRMDAMRTRGKELFAKVYYYKDGQAAATPAKH